MRKITKRSVTLFEILIVMVLVSFALGVMALPVSKALKGERFERGVDEFIQRITLAQELMLDFRCDVWLKLSQEKDAVLCTLKTEAPLPPHLMKSLNRHMRIKGITGITFREEPLTELCFEGGLGSFPRGLLTLIGEKKKETLFLKGFPAHIQRGKNETAACCTAGYPEEILSAL